MNTDMKYTIDIMEKILTTPSPSGYTEEVMTLVENEFKNMGIETRKTVKGALIATIKGEDESKERTLSAHVDTLGAMVKEVKGNGRLKLTQLGGYPWSAIEGEYCTVLTSEGKKYSGTIVLTHASSHVYSDAASLKRDENSIEVRLDEKTSSGDDTKKLGIGVGDFVFFDPRTTVTESGFIKSRHLDDKACVASILGTAKYIVDNNLTPKYTTNFFISNYEEVGHGACASLPEKTFEFVAIDMAAPGDGQTSDEFKVTICAKDSSGPYDYELRKHLVSLAKEAELDYVVDIYPYYGSDASAAIRAGWDVKHGLIGPGVDASHAYERTHSDAVDATVKLSVKYIMS